MGRQDRRCCPHSYRGSDEADGGARVACASNGETMTRVFSTQTTRRTQRIRSVWLFVSFVSIVLGPPQAAAQMTGAPAAGYKREPGMTASTIPAPLREIGFDQNLDQRVPLDTPLVD